MLHISNNNFLGGPSSDVARAVTLNKVPDSTCEWNWRRYRPDFTITRMCAGRAQSDRQQGICKVSHIVYNIYM